MPSQQILKGRYRAEEVIGTGTYGHVMKAVDLNTNKFVAVKVAHRETAYRRSALNECHVLSTLRNCSAVIHANDTFEEDGRIHIVQDLLHKNLYEHLRDQKFAPVPLDVVRRVGTVVCEGLRALHATGYIHCDIKPENVMMCAPGNLTDFRLIDFGAVRKFEENQYYDVQSLWYRAPEVICGLPYSAAIDSWSVGCLLYELHTGNPLFAGGDGREQLGLIIEMCGCPSRQAMTCGKFSQTLSFIPANSDGKMQRIEDCLIGDSVTCGKFADLLYALLRPDESQRLTVTDALNHPFFTGAPLGPTMVPGVHVPRGLLTPGGLTEASLMSFGSQRSGVITDEDSIDNSTFNDSMFGSSNVSPYKNGGFSAVSTPSCLAGGHIGPKSVDVEWSM